MADRSQFRLLAERRFGPFFATQFLGAFNDNVFKNALVASIVFGATASGKDSATLVNVAAGLFILPFFLCSASAGVIADAIDEKALAAVVAIDAVPREKMIADIAPRTVELFSTELKKSKTVFWNGPLGVEEIPQFANGTEAIAGLLSKLKAKTIVGGGSTSEVISKLGLADKMTFVSTGGGASLEFLGGDELPGVAALKDKI